MKIKKLFKPTILACASILGASLSYALPSAERYGDIHKLSEGNRGQVSDMDQPIFFEDHDDSNLYYAPYDKVFITDKKVEGSEPLFGLAYDRNGGLLSFTVRAGFSEARKAVIAKYQSEGKFVEPLAPISGMWALTLNTNNTEIFLGAPTQIDTVLPDIPVAMSVLLGKHAIRYIVAAYNTGASLGVNYHYKFRAVLTPMQIKASIHWRNFRKMVEEETVTATTAKVSASGTYYWFTASGSASVTSVSQVRKLVQMAIERKHVKIWHRGGGGNMATEERDKRLLDEVTKVVMGQQFKPIESQWRPIEITMPTASCEAKLKRRRSLFGRAFGASGSACYARATSYVWNSEMIYEDREYTYEVTSEAIVNLPAAVGSNFSYLCRDYPGLFINIVPLIWLFIDKAIVKTFHR